MAKGEGILALLDDNGKSGTDNEDSGDDELDAMKDFLSAVEEKDPKAMKLAFARAYAACKGGSDEEY